MRLKYFNLVVFVLLHLCESKLGGWTQCEDPLMEGFGGHSILCSPKEICLDGQCVCPEGTQNDGGRGCIDVDECLVDYPCPGTQGIESFCVDHDHDNNYFKCGCLPGYKPLYQKDYDQSVTNIPVEYRPRECVETFLIKHIELDLIVSVPPETDIAGIVEDYKARKRSLINSLAVTVSRDLTLTAKLKTVEIFVTPTGTTFYMDIF